MEDPPYYGEGNKVTCLAPCQTRAKFRVSSDTQGELALSSLHSATRNSHNCPMLPHDSHDSHDSHASWEGCIQCNRHVL